MAFNNFGNRFQQTTPIVLNLVIINVLVYLAQIVTGGDVEPNAAADLFALHHYKSIYFQPYQVVTHMFMHGGFFHIPCLLLLGSGRFLQSYGAIINDPTSVSRTRLCFV